ncbi:MAG: lipopolysaccharide export system permease protein [Desulfovibrionales bacterium]|nr:lipopolysaccharide export system permease protein [Desulfovibrionales bacterium]
MIQSPISHLGRYLVRQNLFLILLCLGAGIGVYLLIDIFDRVDNFLEAGLSVGVMATYFAAKIPLIVSQVLPMVFLLSMVIQLGVMARNRELLALQAGGQSAWRMAKFFLTYALVFSLIQLVFSEYLGVAGLQITSRIWKEQVRDSESHGVVHNLWFTEGQRIVRLGEAWPAEGKAANVEIYDMSGDGATVLDFMAARRAEAGDQGWTLYDVRVLDPATFATEKRASLQLPMKRRLDAYESVSPKVDPAQIPLWRLSWVIDELRASGSNVEGLQTAWHMKWAYAFSIATLALAALAVFSFTQNIYVNIFAAIFVSFLFYGVYVVGGTAGQKGLAAPWIAAWFGNIMVTVLAGLRLLWRYRPRRLKRREPAS